MLALAGGTGLVAKPVRSPRDSAYNGEMKSSEPSQDSLARLFALQADLNRRIGRDTAALHERFDSQTAGSWLNDYIIAASNELEELRNCTFWKHWCAEAKGGERFKLHDLQNARVEVIDLLFFWISMAQCLGLTADDVVHLYLQKLKVNHERQENRYSMTGKTEDDNRGITLER